MNIRDKVLEYITHSSYVSYVELQRIVGEEQGAGSQAHSFEDFNIDLWWGMSKELAVAIESLHNDHLIHSHASTPLVYAIDGGLPQMAIAKSMRKYKKPRWLPVVFQPGESCDTCS